MAAINVRAVIDAGQVVASLGVRIPAATTAEDVRDPSRHKVVVKKGTRHRAQVEAIVTAGVQSCAAAGAHRPRTVTGRLRK